MSRLLERLQIIRPSYCPEWGSGGIFGLRYHRGVLYFTVAFDARAYFIDDHVRIYDYSLVGPGPRSGGDTYNAVESVDNRIFFGGWVHAPVTYELRNGQVRVLFRGKHAHVHEYDVDNDEVRLLWKETIGHDDKWCGEVSEMVYDHLNDRLVVARGDGHESLGLYEIKLRGYRKASRISDLPSIKGCRFLDVMCFDVLRDWERGVEGLQVLDLVRNKIDVIRIEDYGKISVDGGDVKKPLPGCACSIYSTFYLFVRGGVIFGNPLEGEMRFARLLDIGLGYSPCRTNALPAGGGLLVAYNAYAHGQVFKTTREDVERSKVLDFKHGPSVLIYVTPPFAKIVGALGARVTSLERAGSHILVATNTMPNLVTYRSTLVDSGCKSIVVLSDDVLLRDQPRLVLKVNQVGLEDVWGGVPLTGYRDAKLVMYLTSSGALSVIEYELSEDSQPDVERYSVSSGKNVIELSGFRRVVSFRLEGPSGFRAYLVLE